MSTYLHALNWETQLVCCIGNYAVIVSIAIERQILHWPVWIKNKYQKMPLWSIRLVENNERTFSGHLSIKHQHLKCPWSSYVIHSEGSSWQGKVHPQSVSWQTLLAQQAPSGVTGNLSAQKLCGPILKVANPINYSGSNSLLRSDCGLISGLTQITEQWVWQMDWPTVGVALA